MGTQRMMHEIHRNGVPAGVVQLQHVVQDECKAEQCDANKKIRNTKKNKKHKSSQLDTGAELPQITRSINYCPVF